MRDLLEAHADDEVSADEPRERLVTPAAADKAAEPLPMEPSECVALAEAYLNHGGSFRAELLHNFPQRANGIIYRVLKFALRCEDFQTAVMAGEYLVRHEPNNDRTLALLVQAYRGIGRTADAIEVLHRIARILHTRADAASRQAEALDCDARVACLEGEGKLLDVLQVYLDAHDNIHIASVWARIEANITRVELVLDQGTLSRLDNKECLIRLGKLTERLDRWDEAYLVQVRLREIEGDKNLFFLARAALRSGRAAIALSLLEDIKRDGKGTHPQFDEYVCEARRQVEIGAIAWPEFIGGLNRRMRELPLRYPGRRRDETRAAPSDSLEICTALEPKIAQNIPRIPANASFWALFDLTLRHLKDGKIDPETVRMLHDATQRYGIAS